MAYGLATPLGSGRSQEKEGISRIRKQELYRQFPEWSVTTLLLCYEF